MQRIVTSILGLLLGLASAARIEPDLLRRLEAADNPNQKFAISFVMKDQALATDLDPNIPNLPKPERRARVGRVLMDYAEASQQDLLANLKAREAEGKVDGLNSLWIVNEVACFATRDVIYEAASRADVSDVLCDLVQADMGLVNTPQRDIHEPNLDIIHAPGAWQQGYTGQGVVVGEIDTGIWYTHLDLRNRLWTSPEYPHPGFNYASHILFPSASNPSPNDTTENIDYVIGHGTHVAGIAVADGSYGNGTHDTIGVAPGAHILVCCALVYFNNDNSGETLLEQSVLLGFQFCIRPPRDTLNGADVVTTSLGILDSYHPRYAEYRVAEENVMAAGLTHAISAGTEGPGGIRCPADCPPPWPNPANGVGGPSAVLTVSAYDLSGSSGGPTTIWGTIPPWYDYVNPPGLTDPDLVTPGVNIFSTFWQGDQAYTTMSGTSMATPEVAGCVALMLSKNPNLSPREADSIIETSAQDLGIPGKDNTYGAGLINCSLAVARTPWPEPVHDVAMGAILAPGVEVDAGVPTAPEVCVVNAGAYHETSIPVHFAIDSAGTRIYDHTTMLPNLDSGAVDSVTFTSWTPGPSGNRYQITAWHSFSPDTNQGNDTAYRTTVVRTHEVRTVSMNIGDRVRAGHPFTPGLTISSADYVEHNVTCCCWIDSLGTRIYDQSVVVDSVKAGGTAAATFPSWNVGGSGSAYDVTMFNTFPDTGLGNDTLTRTTVATNQLLVLIAYADVSAPDTLIRGLRDLGDSVETFLATSRTPNLAQIAPYDGVITFSSYYYQNPVAMGDTLAVFSDLGRAVVIGAYAFTTGYDIQGAILTGDYATLAPASNSHDATSLGWFNASHPIMAGITSVATGYAFRNTWAAGSESVAKWSNQSPYVATSPNQHVVGINDYPGYANQNRGGRDWVKVYHQALLWASGGNPGISDRSSFSIAPSYVICIIKPNPMTGSTTVSYSLPNPVPVEITVYDLSGRRVATLVNANQKTGWHKVTWNRADASGNRVAPGIYFYALKAGSYSTVRKLVVVE